MEFVTLPTGSVMAQELLDHEIKQEIKEEVSKKT